MHDVDSGLDAVTMRKAAAVSVGSDVVDAILGNGSDSRAAAREAVTNAADGGLGGGVEGHGSAA